MKKGQKVYICETTQNWSNKHSQVMRRTSREPATVERVTKSFVVVNGAKFRLRATKGQTVRRGWHSYQTGVKPALSEIKGDRYLVDATIYDKRALRELVCQQISALREEISKKLTLEQLQEISDFLATRVK
jgi:hypothetical protein